MRISIPSPPPSRTMNGFAYYFESTARSAASTAERGRALLEWLRALGFRHSLGGDESVTFLSDEGEPTESTWADVSRHLVRGRVTLKSWIGTCEDLVFSVDSTPSHSVEWYSLSYLEASTAVRLGNSLIERFRVRAASELEDFLVWDWTGASEDLDWPALVEGSSIPPVGPDVLGLPTRLLGGLREQVGMESEVIGRSALLVWPTATSYVMP